MRYDHRDFRAREGFERARAWERQQWGRGAPPHQEEHGDPHLDSGRYGPARYGLGPYYERLRRLRRSDEELKEAVEEALFYDTWVNADAITVEVEDGVVTLTGELPNFEEVRFATDDAWDVDGVLGVRCKLHVDDDL